ncbi:hypothetical protein E2C01_042386 [Portunus trituberculatus]|uniref:Uncharacterized protein n=1 Tax=Portunus trituberculatus TaxID=210409 RepID=A0A5B7FUN3_PORTR|nr:hypothetical protein [Portunus trituberculatus]
MIKAPFQAVSLPLEDIIHTPIGKTMNPTTLSDLRLIAITPLPSFLWKSFVIDWVYEDLAP